MSTFSRAVAIAALLAMVTAALADGIRNPVTSNLLGFDGVNNTGSGGGPPPTPCGAVGLDFTDACGTTQLMVMLR